MTAKLSRPINLKIDDHLFTLSCDNYFISLFIGLEIRLTVLQYTGGENAYIQKLNLLSTSKFQILYGPQLVKIGLIGLM